MALAGPVVVGATGHRLVRRGGFMRSGVPAEEAKADAEDRAPRVSETTAERGVLRDFVASRRGAGKIGRAAERSTFATTNRSSPG